MLKSSGRVGQAEPCKGVAQAQIQQSWKPLIYADWTLMFVSYQKGTRECVPSVAHRAPAAVNLHCADSHHKRNISGNKRSPAMPALRLMNKHMLYYALGC